jgi:hypothetical protein
MNRATLHLLLLSALTGCADGALSVDAADAADTTADIPVGDSPADLPSDDVPRDMTVDAPIPDLGDVVTPDSAENIIEEPECPSQGPAYVHGDLWAYWHNYRVACDAQHKWLWVCEQRLGADACGPERQRFEDCWNARGDFPASNWENATPTPHSPNWGVCQPHHWPEKNSAESRPGNDVPCDTSRFDYDTLRTGDPRYGVDWWAGGISMRHLSLKVFDGDHDIVTSQGRADGMVNLSTHPGEEEAFMSGLSNHNYPGAARDGCLPSLTGGDEEPWPSQNFGAFAWLEVPSARPVTLAASWIGTVGGNIADGCIRQPWAFPASFSAHSVDGKPWFTSSPCWDVQRNVQLEPGAHYLWDVHGFHKMESCDGPPQQLREVLGSCVP